jgi:hypothetical protein
MATHDEEAPESAPLLGSRHQEDEVEYWEEVTDTGGTDVIQFSAPMYFADENDENITLEIVRMGNLEGKVAIKYYTLDGSAQGSTSFDTNDYESQCRRVVFQPGEHTKSIVINVFDSTEGLWSPTIEFKVLLSEAENCQMGAYLHSARVKIFNNDPFPSEVVEEVKEGKDRIKAVPHWMLFWRILQSQLQQCRLQMADALDSGDGSNE